MNVTDLPQACISLIENVPGIDFIDEDFAIFDNIDDIPSLDHPMRIDAVVFALCTKGCELWRRSRDSISPGWTLGRTLCRRPHSVLAPYPGKSLLPAFRFAARPTSGTIYSRPRKKSSVGKCRCPHRQERYSPRPHSYSTPGVLRRWLVSAVPGSCGSACRPACAPTVASLCMGYFSCVPPFVFRCRSPRKGFLPHSCGVFRRWRAPHSFGTTCPEVTSGQSVQKLAPCGASPARVFLFGRSFCFQCAVHR